MVAKAEAAKTEPASNAAATKPVEAVDEFKALFAGDKGFERVDIPEVDGWFKAEAGAFFYGRIISHFQIADDKKGTMRDIIVLKLGADCKSTVQKGSKETQTMAKGGVLAVGITHKLKPLLEYVTNKGIVAAKALSKDSIGGGQTMWTYEINCKGEKAAPPASAILTQAEGAAATGTKFDDIPF